MWPIFSLGHAQPCRLTALRCKGSCKCQPQAPSLDTQDKRQWLRHNVIHWLHLEPRTYSGLKGLLPDDHQLLKPCDTKVAVSEQYPVCSRGWRSAPECAVHGRGSFTNVSSFEGVEASTAACRCCLKWLSSTAGAQMQCICTSCGQSFAES